MSKRRVQERKKHRHKEQKKIDSPVVTVPENGR
jgi:hypothetical protein